MHTKKWIYIIENIDSHSKNLYSPPNFTSHSLSTLKMDIDTWKYWYPQLIFTLNIDILPQNSLHILILCSAYQMDIFQILTFVNINNAVYQILITTTLHDVNIIPIHWLLVLSPSFAWIMKKEFFCVISQVYNWETNLQWRIWCW